MWSKVNVIRAVSAIVARRALKFFGLVAAAIFLVVLLIISALAYFFSNWWLLLLVIYLPLLLIAGGVFLLARFIVRRLYPAEISPEQTKLLTNFADKVQRLIEARTMGWPVFVLLNFKDLLLHRDLKTTKDLIANTASLKRDFAELEQTLSAANAQE